MTERSLTREQLGLLNYLHGVLTQPQGAWDGFYMPLSPSMNFALRYQLAFSTYALAALATHTPSYRAPYEEAIRGAIEKMLHPDVWSYWRVPAEEPALASANSGHIAVLLSPHTRTASGPPTDPVARDNLQYSGHLSTMLGLYTKLSGDKRYSSPFTLHDAVSGVSFSYTYSQVAERIHSQMLANPFGGVCCESGMAYVPCNNHALASNSLHDAVYGTHFSAANAKWLDWVGKRMLLKGPAARGVFGTAYMKDLHVTTPVAFNYTDAWGLAMMRPFDGPLVKKLYRKFRRKISRTREGGAYLDSSSVSEKMEISDTPINTAFALAAARGAGDRAYSEALERYLREECEAGWQNGVYLLRGAARTLQATAVYALASATDMGGENLVSLFNSPAAADSRLMPYVVSVTPPDGSLGVSQARYSEEEKAMTLGLRALGSVDTKSPAAQASVVFGNLKSLPTVEIGGNKLDTEGQAVQQDGTLRLTLPVAPEGETLVVLRF